MNKPEDYQEEAAAPFNVADLLDEPQAIEAYIGDLQVKIERLQAAMDEITAIAIAAKG